MVYANLHTEEITERTLDPYFAEPYGTCTMTSMVNHALEMRPWIRGWGPDCEVLEPEDLRRQIGEDMRRAAVVYGRAEGE